MGQGRFVNQKLAKRTGFAARQSKGKVAGLPREKPARGARNRRAIMIPGRNPQPVRCGT